MEADHLPFRKRFIGMNIPRVPFYCEENIWQLCVDFTAAGLRCRAVFISNERRQCALRRQKVSPDEDGLVVWDYHVIALTDEDAVMVWDPDSTLGAPCPAEEYLAGTFIFSSDLPDIYDPLFRVVPGELYAERLVSDRSHMLDGRGGYLQTPPDWPPPGAVNGKFRGPVNLQSFIDMKISFLGEVMDLARFRRFCKTGF